MKAAAPSRQEDDGYERGRAEGYASALAEFEQRIEQEKQALQAQAAEERQRLLNETAAKLAGDIAEMGDQLQGRIKGVAARLLEPLIVTPYRNRRLLRSSSIFRQLRPIAAARSRASQAHRTCSN